MDTEVEQFIGRFDSDSNLKDVQVDVGDGEVRNVPRSKDVSKGNLLRGKDGEHYCRSWTTRNPYQNHYDLIRRSRLYSGGGSDTGPFPGPYQSTLEDNGHVKMSLIKVMTLKLGHHQVRHHQGVFLMR